MIRLFAHHPTAANLLLLGIVVAGLSVLPGLQRETFPDFAPSQVEVRVAYPGASAGEVEEAVCQRIEDALDGVRYLSRINAEARESVGVVVAEMEDGGDFSTFKDDIDVAVQGIADFPDDAEDPVITEQGTRDLVLVLIVSGPMTSADLKAYCEHLKRRLQELPQVSLVDINGFSDHQLRVNLDPAALLRHGLSVEQVAGLVAAQSVDLPAGAVEASESDVLVRFVEQRRTPAELEDLVLIAGPGGSEIRLGELGDVVDTFELDEERALFEGERAGLLQVKKAKRQDSIRVAEAVKSFVADELLRRPQVRIEVTQDQSTRLIDRLSMLLTNGWQGILLVFLALWLFFSFRLSFWVAASLPVSFLGGLFFMPMLGLTINMMTMVGLLLALGLLMDDGIVIAENVATHRSRGKPPMQAAVDGVREVAPGVLSSFLTTVAVLGPLVLIKGTLGKVLLVIPLVLILVMAVSLVEAFLILPAHLGHALKHVDPEPSGFRGRFEAGIEWLREHALGRVVDWALARRYLFLGVVGLCFLGSLAMFVGGVVKFRAFPDLDGDVLVARVLLPQGTPLARTEEVVAQILGGLQGADAQLSPLERDGQQLVRTVSVRFNTNTEAFEAGPHVATITVDLLDAEQRRTRLDDVISVWREQAGRLPDVLSLSIGEPAFGPAGRAIEIQLQGSDPQTLKSAAMDLKAWLATFDGVSNLADDLRPGKPELRFALKEGALGLGMKAESAARQLRAALQGVTADELQVGSEAYEVDVRLAPRGQDSLADLDYLYLTLPSGVQVPAGTVTRWEEGRGWARIARVDGKRTVSVRGDVDANLTNLTDLVRTLEARLRPELEERYPDLELHYEGEVKESGITQASMVHSALIGLIGVFLLLSFQFKSYVEPLVVMTAIPLALIGVVWGHLLLGMDVSMPSLLGFASLAGVVVNDSLLLVLFLKRARASGAPVVASASQASRQRFRAIVLTSLTTGAGLLPLMFERSLQAQVLIPLAVSIVFGMLASTVLVLVVIPCLYAVLGDLGLLTRVEPSDRVPPKPEPGEEPDPAAEPELTPESDTEAEPAGDTETEGDQAAPPEDVGKEEPPGT